MQQQRQQLFDECLACIDTYLEFSHALPLDISAKVASQLAQVDQVLEGGSLPVEQKALGFYIKAGLQLLKQNKASATEALLLKSVESLDQDEPQLC